MTTAHKVTVAVSVLLAVFLVFAGYGWIKEHESAVVVNAQVTADKAAQAVIAASESKNQQQLATALAGYAAMKQSAQTPAQVVQALPQVIQLPAPIVQVTAAQAAAANAAAPASVAGLPDAPKLAVGDLVIPAADVKPFYDAQVDCKVNAAKAASCAETTTNLTALNASKDTEIAQLQVAVKGGTRWQRAGRALKMIGIGAAVGAGAVAIAEHH